MICGFTGKGNLWPCKKTIGQAVCQPLTVKNSLISLLSVFRGRATHGRERRLAPVTSSGVMAGSPTLDIFMATRTTSSILNAWALGAQALPLPDRDGAVMSTPRDSIWIVSSRPLPWGRASCSKRTSRKCFRRTPRPTC